MCLLLCVAGMALLETTQVLQTSDVAFGVMQFYVLVMHLQPTFQQLYNI
jgi:hypothetical protein